MCAEAHYSVDSPSCNRVYSYDENYAVNVNEKFDIILLLTFLGWSACVVLGVFKFFKDSAIVNLLYLTQLLTVAGFIMLHIYRFQPAAYFCSGRYNPPNWSDAPLKSKGNFLLGYMITVWVIVGLTCCCLTMLCCAAVAK